MNLKKIISMGALLSVLCGAQPLLADTQTLEILGGVGQPGDIDHYTDASRDGGQSWQPAYLTGWHPWGFIPGTDSWINFDPSPFVGLNSTTLYRVRFIAPSEWSDPRMDVLIKADNLAEVSFNGRYIATIEGANSINADLIFSEALKPGVNEILISLQDFGGWVGFNYRIDMQIEADQPFELIEAPPSSLFFEDFESGNLDKWTGKYNGPHSGFLTSDPLDPNNTVFAMSQNIGSGDVFGGPVTPTTPHIVQFDYLGSLYSGGCIGYSYGAPGSHAWPFCGHPGYNAEHEIGQWVTCYFEIPTGVPTYVMLEDYSFGTGNAYFDNISVIEGSGQGCGLRDAVVDSDGDGIPDDQDAFPNDVNESVDSDGDGVGDNSDVFPNDPTESKDTDGDGVGDNRDAFPTDPAETLDSDGDGVGDNSDVFPNDATESADSDGDGIGDNADALDSSDTSASVVVDGVDSGVANRNLGGGYTLADKVTIAAGNCKLGAANHGQYVSCMAKFHNGLLNSGIISAAEKDALQSAAAQTTFGKKGK